ncbi:MAG: hypothetical protein PHU61_03355 [Candidatus Absconditabacteria bacterium]|nr:hypothetical protein [Candidatus Absconditabacteria bacterium]MDD3868302.1 hypothetical protein [Candidatus Absconditabacteria bacterium]MDD4714009.1 hypothetical protein [Candidatus Absconditabacteria bacterium]
MLRFFITVYGILGLINFAAYLPKMNDSDIEIFKANPYSYIFWIISSIIFFIYGLLVLKNVLLLLLIAIELILIIMYFVYFVCQKKNLFKKKFSQLLKKQKNSRAFFK